MKYLMILALLVSFGCKDDKNTVRVPTPNSGSGSGDIQPSPSPTPNPTPVPTPIPSPGPTPSGDVYFEVGVSYDIPAGAYSIFSTTRRYRCEYFVHRSTYDQKIYANTRVLLTRVRETTDFSKLSFRPQRVNQPVIAYDIQFKHPVLKRAHCQTSNTNMPLIKLLEKSFSDERRLSTRVRRQLP